MLDIKRIRKEPEKVAELLKRRGDIDITPILERDEKRRVIISQVEELKAQQNAASKKIPAMKKAGEDTTALMAEMKEIAAKAKVLDTELAELEAEINTLLLSTPNIPNENIVIGASDADNKEIRKVGTPREFDFELKAHWDLGTDLGILDFERAAKIAGARFSMWVGLGSKLERAIISFMLDMHTPKGYLEIIPPYMVNRASMTGTGQLPKFEEDAFNVRNNDRNHLLI